MAFNDILIQTLEGNKSSRPPVWLMRQAGRYMQEYRSIRENVSFLELCRNPDLAVEVTLQPVNVLGVDAAILFSDILIPVEPMGCSLDFIPSPVIKNPVRDLKAAQDLKVYNPAEKTGFVYEIIKKLVKKLNVPLIGFAGAPFTLACYIVEGGASKSYLEIKKLMYNDEKAYNTLMEKLTEVTIAYLQLQIDSGCPVVQLFDTWAGIVSPLCYREKIYPWVEKVVSGLKGAQVIYFAKDSAGSYGSIKNLKCHGIGVDWRTELATADALLEHKFVLQGNVDPCILFAGRSIIAETVQYTVEEGKKLPGHIFNLGHGILPSTSVENVKYMVDCIKGTV